MQALIGRPGGFEAKAISGSAAGDERWSAPMTAAFVASSSVVLWAGIIAAARWLIG